MHSSPPGIVLVGFFYSDEGDPLLLRSHADIGGDQRDLASVAAPLAQAALRGFPSEYGEHKVLFPR
ncbi:MAG: hypothetical protein ACP5GF_13370 [Thiomonas sp.]